VMSPIVDGFIKGIVIGLVIGLCYFGSPFF
jgi:hypothetical protein